MRRHIALFTALTAGVFLTAACDGAPAEEAMAEMDAAAPQAAPATPAVGGQTDCFLRGATLAEARSRPSPLRELRFSYDGGEALLCYGAPSARGRTIMGGLVPYGQPWRGGANEPTTIHLTGPATIGSVAVQPGSYSLYMVPGEKEWRVYVNSNYERWGIPINDAVRRTEIGGATIRPESTDAMVETLTYRHAEGALVMEWENTRVRIPIAGAGS